MDAVVAMSNASGANSVMVSAWLIQTCGWKARREGNVGTHETQPLVIVNYGEATGKEIFEFGKKIQDSVYQKFNIELEMEVNIIT